MIKKKINIYTKKNFVILFILLNFFISFYTTNEFFNSEEIDLGILSSRLIFDNFPSFFSDKINLGIINPIGAGSFFHPLNIFLLINKDIYIFIYKFFHLCLQLYFFIKILKLLKVREFYFILTFSLIYLPNFHYLTSWWLSCLFSYSMLFLNLYYIFKYFKKNCDKDLYKFSLTIIISFYFGHPGLVLQYSLVFFLIILFSFLLNKKIKLILLIKNFGLIFFSLFYYLIFLKLNIADGFEERIAHGPFSRYLYNISSINNSFKSIDFETFNIFLNLVYFVPAFALFYFLIKKNYKYVLLNIVILVVINLNLIIRVPYLLGLGELVRIYLVKHLNFIPGLTYFRDIIIILSVCSLVILLKKNKSSYLNFLTILIFVFPFFLIFIDIFQNDKSNNFNFLNNKKNTFLNFYPEKKNLNRLYIDDALKKKISSGSLRNYNIYGFSDFIDFGFSVVNTPVKFNKTISNFPINLSGVEYFASLNKFFNIKNHEYKNFKLIHDIKLNENITIYIFKNTNFIFLSLDKINFDKLNKCFESQTKKCFSSLHYNNSVNLLKIDNGEYRLINNSNSKTFFIFPFNFAKKWKITGAKRIILKNYLFVEIEKNSFARISFQNKQVYFLFFSFFSFFLLLYLINRKIR